MGASKKITISIDITVAEQAEAVAQQLNMSRNQVIEAAIQAFTNNRTLLENRNQGQGQLNTAAQVSNQLVINQGDVFWVQLDDASGLEPGIPHPHMVVQDDVFNYSRIKTVITCALTSNLKRVDRPGNVLLETGEANLPRQSVVEVSKVFTLEKVHLGEYIGSVSEGRIKQVLAGMRFLQTTFLKRT